LCLYILQEFYRQSFNDITKKIVCKIHLSACVAANEFLEQ